MRRALVTEDRHFRVLNEVDFPKISAMNIEAFKTLLQAS